jgi:hypothetical protein
LDRPAVQEIIMQRPLQASFVLTALMSMFLLGSPAHGYIGIAMQPIPETFVIADVVVVGKITAKEKETVHAQIYPDNKTAKWDFQIFELTASSVIKGKEVKTFRVAVPQLPQHMRPIEAEIGGRKKLLNPEAKIGSEGVFLLIKHCERDFYVLPTLGGFLEKSEADHEQECAQLRRCARLLRNPDESLRSKQKEDRFLTAYMLVYEYCARPGRMAASKGVVAEPVDAKHSRLILHALLDDGDWTAAGKPAFTGPLGRVYPHQLLASITLDDAAMKKKPTVKPFPVEEYAKEGRKWLEDVRDTAQLQRLVRKAK